METNMQQKIKKLIVSIVIIIPVAILALWILFPEPDLMLINKLSSSTLSIEVQTTNSVLEDTVSIVGECSTLENVDAELIGTYDKLIAYMNNSQQTLRFVFDNSLFLTKTSNVAKNLTQTENAHKEMIAQYDACNNYLTNNFKPHLQSEVLYGEMVNAYLQTYKAFFNSYAVALANFNTKAMKTLDEATRITGYINPLTLGAYQVKAQWELLCVLENQKEMPSANLAQIELSYQNYVAQEEFNGEFSQYFNNIPNSVVFREVSQSSQILEILAVAGTAEQETLIASLQTGLAPKVAIFYTVLFNLAFFN